MDSMKALEELDGDQIETYIVWKVHLSEKTEERLCNWSSLKFKNLQIRQSKKALSY